MRRDSTWPLTVMWKIKKQFWGSIPPSPDTDGCLLFCLQQLKLKELCTFLVVPSVSTVSSLIEEVIWKDNLDHPPLKNMPARPCVPSPFSFFWLPLSACIWCHYISDHMAKGCCVASHVCSRRVTHCCQTLNCYGHKGHLLRAYSLTMIGTWWKSWFSCFCEPIYCCWTRPSDHVPFN